MVVTVLACAGSACAMHQHQEVTVIVQPDEPLRGYSTGPLSLGESPSDLNARQINAALDGYGIWLDSAEYGRIWRPNEALVRGTFAPYTSEGRWVATTGGWYWQSAYAWGRVPFHYGRWVLEGSLWSWVPGSQFAPAWVDWRIRGGWVGWAALAPLGAHSWSPFVYCAHAGLGGPGVDGRLVRGAAGSSLYARTTAVAADGDTPRGPVASPGPVAAVPLQQVWNTPLPNSSPMGRPATVVASAVGVDSVERIPVARTHEAPPVVDPPVGGVAVVIRDRDLIGMSEGPSVRRPAGAAAPLPDNVIRSRPLTVEFALPVGAARVADGAPPPLPPPPDGVASGGFFGSYPMRAPMAFSSHRASMGGPSFGGASVIVAPSPQPVTQPVAQPVVQPRSVGASGAWFGSRGGSLAGSPRPSGPLSSLR